MSTVAVLQRQFANNGRALFGPQFVTPGGGGGGGTPVAFVGTLTDRSAVVGTPFTMATASHFTGDETPFVYSLSSGVLPAGLTLDAATGLVSGTPTVVGVLVGIVVRATDTGANHADSNAFIVTVRPPSTNVSRPPLDRRLSVPFDDRQLIVAKEDRRYVVPYKS